MRRGQRAEVLRRRKEALERLRESKFFEKVNKKGVARTQEKWQSRKDAEIEILEKLVSSGSY